MPDTRSMGWSELVLATRNLNKLEEILMLLGDLGITIRTFHDFPSFPEIDETGETCEANAIKKALGIAKFSGLPSLADDTGLEVDALGGRPGVYAARFAGEQATYRDNCEKLLLELKGVPAHQRSAQFITLVALADPSGSVEVVEGILQGRIAEQPAGTEGFGYDPVFEVPELGRTLAELTLEQKNRISHRAQALYKAKAVLKQKILNENESGRSAAR